MHTGKGAPDDTCQVGVPSGVNIANRGLVLDETIGAVVAYCTFGAGNAAGGSGAPDSHLFRVGDGRLRYVHTLIHLLQSNFLGTIPGRRGGAEGPGGQAAERRRKTGDHELISKGGCCGSAGCRHLQQRGDFDRLTVRLVIG